MWTDNSSQYRIALVGSADAIAGEVLKVMHERQLPINELRIMVAGSSDRRRFLFQENALPIIEVSVGGFTNLDAVIFLTSADISHQYAAQALQNNAIVIDATPALRRDPRVPLIAPGVNSDLLNLHPRIVAIPSPLSIAMAMVLKPLHTVVGVKRVDATAILSAAGMGTAGVEELNSNVRAVTAGRSIAPHVFPHQLAFNLLPETDVFLDNGFTHDEWQTWFELRRLLEDDELNVAMTAVRASVFLGDSVAMRVALKGRIEVDDIRRLLAGAPGVKVLDDPAVSLYPQPWAAAGQDEVLVGRLREDYTERYTVMLWISYDNVRRGIAIPCVDALEALLES